MLAGTEESCQLCLRPIDQSDFNLGWHSARQGRNVTRKSVSHLWSYLYHQNVRECFPVSTASGVNENELSKELGLPKLTFSFSMGGPAAVNANDKNAACSVIMCEECCAEFEKLDLLHIQLERVKKSVEHQVLNINNRIRARNNSIPSVLSGPARNLEMSFGGSTIGKENVSRALRFLSQLCGDEHPSPSTSNCSTVPVIGEREAEPIQGEELFQQFQTIKLEDSSISSNIMNPSIEPGNTITPGGTVSGTESSFYTAASNARRFIMEMDMENAEYHTQVFKLDPEPETTETPAVKNYEDATPPKANSLKTRCRKLASKNAVRTERNSLQRRQPFSVPDPELADLGEEVIAAPRNTSKCSIRKPQGQKMKTDYKCTVCGRVFMTKIDFTRHIRTHTGEKPFQCGICYKQFALKWNLQVHFAVHSEERPFKCDICDFAFARKSHLTRHYKNLHSKQKC